MTILSVLYKEALDTIWANPSGDRAAIFKSVKMTPSEGVIGVLRLPYITLDMPTVSDRYACYELGNVPSNSIGLDNLGFDWVSLQSLTPETFILGISQGRCITLQNSYIQITNNNNLVIAIDYHLNNRILQLNDDLYFRFYSNIFYSGVIPEPFQKIKFSTIIFNSSDIASYQAFKTLALNNSTALLCYKNGLFLPDNLPDEGNLLNGDIIEYYFDPFIVSAHHFLLSDLNSYTSDLDSVNKVLLSVSSLPQLIYVDDIEIYVYGTMSDGQKVGVYFPRLQPSAIRMLTYKDWGVDTQLLEGRITELGNFIDVDQTLTDISLLVFRRNNGQIKAAIRDSNCIYDLMNLPVEKRKMALSGANATIELWQAQTLENSNLYNWISLPYRSLSPTTINGVFSRNGVISFYERTKKNSSTDNWELPPNKIVGGKTLSYLNNGYAPIFTPYPNPDAVYGNDITVEETTLFFPGNNTGSLDQVIPLLNTANTPVNADYDIFCYYKKDGQLYPAIRNSDFQIIGEGTTASIHWTSNVTFYERYVRTVEKYIAYTKSVTLANITDGIDIYNGRAKSNSVGMHTLLVWLNERYMIEGLDYHVQSGKIYFCSKPDQWAFPAEITVIYFGLPNNALMHVPKGSWGWVKHNEILNDGRYNILLSNNNVFFVDGRALPSAELHLKEAYAGVSILPRAVPFRNGTPYVVIQLPHFINSEVLDALTVSESVEKAKLDNLEDYITQIYPQPVNNSTGVIVKEYELVSIFMNKIINELLLNHLTISPALDYTYEYIWQLTTPYHNLLNIDPATILYDDDYVSVSPRWDTVRANITPYQFTFLNKLNQLLLNDRVSGLNLYFNIV